MFAQNNLYSIYSPGSVRLDEDSIFLYKFEDEKCSPRRVTRIFSYEHLGDGSNPADIFFDPEGSLYYLDGTKGDMYQVDTASGVLTFAFSFDMVSGDYLPGAVSDYNGVFYAVGFFGGRIYSYDPETQEQNVTEPLFPDHDAGYDGTFYNGKFCFTVRRVGELLHKFYCVDLATLEKEFFFDMVIDSTFLPIMGGSQQKQIAVIQNK